MKFKVIRNVSSLQRLSRKLLCRNFKIALVPTMGYLHEGHLSLIRKGLSKADIVITTIFVNPAQFTPSEDFSKYPRDITGDIKKIKEAGGQIVFVPKMEYIYPKDYETFVSVENLTKSLEGKSRPFHFRGVTTIVAKLFNMAQPDYAMFGMKDYQQAMIIKKMTNDLNWPIKIIICPTVREKDGLAMSSRNKFLSPELRLQARALYVSLMESKKMVKKGQNSSAIVRRKMKNIISKIAPSGKIDYIAFTEMETLKPVRIIKKNTIASLTVKFDDVRLIDNKKIS